MSVNTVKVMVPPLTIEPRGAIWASSLVVSLAAVGRMLWSTLEQVGRARARRELAGLTVPDVAHTERARALRTALQGDASR